MLLAVHFTQKNELARRLSCFEPVGEKIHRVRMIAQGVISTLYFPVINRMSCIM